MSTQGTIKRYTLIIRKIISKQLPSKKAVLGYLHEEGFEISFRTLDRDIEQIRNEFGIELNYNRKLNGYEILSEDGISSNALVRFIEILGTADLFAENLRIGNDIFDFISFETQGDLKGIENLRLLITATRKRKTIEFTHLNYETGIRKKYILNPYLLKEYQNRWYAIGTIDDKKTFRTFGIDRMEELIVKNESYQPLKNIDVKELFKDVIGLIYSDIKTEEVIIKIDSFQLKYVESLKLHHSQVVYSENNENFIKLYIKPNFEFKQKLLMMLDRAVVVKPKWLAKEIRQDVENILKNYGK